MLSLTCVMGREMRNVNEPMSARAVGISAIISQNTLFLDCSACVRSSAIPWSITWSPSCTSACALSTSELNAAGRRLVSAGAGPSLVTRSLMSRSSRSMVESCARCSSESCMPSSSRAIER